MLNNVTLVGRLTKDPELKYTPNGVAVCAFAIAVNRNFANQKGEKEADFINCVVWKKPAENMANYLSKGSQIGLTGRIQTRNYEGQDGKKIYITEVVAENISYLEPKGDGSSQGKNKSQGNSQSQGSNQNNDNYQKWKDDPFANDGKTIDITDDDLPF